MEKAEGAFLTIGEMAKRIGVKTHILRYWEEQFPMLRPLTRAGGRRLYRPSDVVLVEQINNLLHRQHYTIRGAVAFLNKGSVPDAPDTAPAASVAIATTTAGNADLASLRGDLLALRNRLADALAAA